MRGVGDLVERLARELELDLIERAEALVLGDHRLARLGQDRHEIRGAARCCSSTRTGRRPRSSGRNPYFTRSSALISRGGGVAFSKKPTLRPSARLPCPRTSRRR